MQAKDVSAAKCRRQILPDVSIDPPPQEKNGATGCCKPPMRHRLSLPEAWAARTLPPTMRAVRRRLWRDPYPPRQLRADYPPWLQEIVLRCLEIEPAWRYPTATQLAFDLSHSTQVKLTARSERLRRDPFTTVLRRRFNTDRDSGGSRSIRRSTRRATTSTSTAWSRCGTGPSR
jgi:serine/threonine protein kinase